MARQETFLFFKFLFGGVRRVWGFHRRPRFQLSRVRQIPRRQLPHRPPLAQKQSWLPATRNWSPTGTAAAEAQSGNGTSLMGLPVFVAPALPTGTVAVNTGALNHLFALMQTIRNSGLCSDTNTGILGIVGSDQPQPDYTTLQPVITVVIVGGQVQVKWNWSGYAAFLDCCEIQVDHADGKVFVMLTKDTTPGYTDTQPFPTARTAWTYRAIYQVNDGRVGVWSQSVSVAVPT